LPDDARSEIAKTLGLPKLPPRIVYLIEEGVSRYRARLKVGPVSAGENIAAIDEALGLADKLEKSLSRFTDAHSGIGEKTAHALNQPATDAVIAIKVFCANAQARKGELRDLGRLGPESGPLGGLCAWLKLTFETVQRSTGRDLNGKTQLRVFARAVFKAAGIPCEKYYCHPHRMDKLFRLTVPDGNETREFIRQLSLEIKDMTAT
jgi:hypothetical protein